MECDLLVLLSDNTSMVCACQPPKDSEVRRFCGHRAAGVSSANENHLASCMGSDGSQMGAVRQAGQPEAKASGLVLPVASAAFNLFPGMPGSSRTR